MVLKTRMRKTNCNRQLSKALVALVQCTSILQKDGAIKKRALFYKSSFAVPDRIIDPFPPIVCMTYKASLTVAEGIVSL